MDFEMPKRVVVDGGQCCGSGCLRCPFTPRHTRGSTTLMDLEMNELDLHGVRHRDVAKVFDQHILLHEPPFKVVTGNSYEMKKVLKEVLDEYKLKYIDWETGSVLVSHDGV